MDLTTILVVIGGLAVVVATTVVGVAVKKLKRSGTTMAAGEFFARMLRKARYESISPAALRRRLAMGHNEAVIIDLRERASYAKGHIDGAVHHQFDDFLKAVVVDGAYDEHRQQNREIILVCDTGHMSRVAGEILVEDEGFRNVVNLRGGMRQWERWQARRRLQENRCCGILLLPACCPATSSQAGG